ncbi:MAG: hypothetical protein ACOC2V_06535 [Alkalispirochaeta sp.]
MPSEQEPNGTARFDPRPFADGLRKRNEEERRRTAIRAEEARREASALAARISRLAGIRRIYLFGSLLADIPSNPDFDIDIAIEGGDIYQAMAVCEGSTWRVDVVDVERVTESVSEAIRSTGRLLYPLDAHGETQL